MNISIFDERVIKPLEALGLEHRFWHINIYTIIYTWVSMFILFALVMIAKFFLKKKLNLISLIFEQTVSFFDNLCRESLGGSFKYEYFAFVSTIFFFTLFGCFVGLLPFMEETTKDLNTAFALGSLSFFYVQYHKIKECGFLAYLKEFAEPLFILLPLNIIGELAKIASMSFRLFGNILGGSIIFLIAINALSNYRATFIIFSLMTLFLYYIINKIVDLKKYKFVNYFLQTLLLCVFFLAGAQMFFGIFEGVVQAFVLTMLTITYLSVALQNEADSSHENILNKKERLANGNS